MGGMQNFSHDSRIFLANEQSGESSSSFIDFRAPSPSNKTHSPPPPLFLSCEMQPLGQRGSVHAHLQRPPAVVQQQHRGGLDPGGCRHRQRTQQCTLGRGELSGTSLQLHLPSPWHTTIVPPTLLHPPAHRPPPTAPWHLSSSLCSTSRRSLRVSASSCSRGATSTLQQQRGGGGGAVQQQR